MRITDCGSPAAATPLIIEENTVADLVPVESRFIESIMLDDYTTVSGDSPISAAMSLHPLTWRNPVTSARRTG